MKRLLKCLVPFSLTKSNMFDMAMPEKETTGKMGGKTM